MMKEIINKFWFNGEDTHFQINEDGEVGFLLRYGTIAVGKLTYRDHIWKFEYSDEFKSQTEIVPLVNFPQKDKVYVSEDLWPFFASRIPSNSQLMGTNDRDQSDLILLLKKYGRLTITNPFELEML